MCEKIKQVGILAILILTIGSVQLYASESEWTSVSESNFNKVVNMNELLDSYAISDTMPTVSVSEKFSLVDGDYVLDNLDEDVIGQYITYHNLHFSSGDEVDIRISITDADLFSTVDEQSIMFTNNMWVSIAGYTNVEFKVDFFVPGTTTPSNQDILFYALDIDLAQVVGEYGMADQIAVSDDSVLDVREANGGSEFSSEKNSATDQSSGVLLYYDDISSLTFNFGINRQGLGSRPDQTDGSLKLDFRIQTEAGNIELYNNDELSAPIENSTFEVDDSSGNQVEVLTTDAAGYAKSSDLPLGDYTIKQVTVGDQYLLNETSYPVSITSKGQLITANEGSPIVNKLVTGSITINNTSTSGETLTGSKFTVTNQTGDTVCSTQIDSSGVAVCDSLPLATYNVSEAVSAPGYRLNTTPQTVTLTLDSPTSTNTFTDQITSGKIKISTTDESDKGIANVKYDIYQGDTKVESLVTDQTGTALSSSLQLGNYTVKEQSVPDGYKKQLNSLPVTLSEDRKTVQVNDGKSVIYEKKITDQPDDKTSGKVVIISQSGIGDHYKIYDQDGNLVEEVVIGEDGTATSSNLPYGKYKIVGPDGTYEFEISKQNVIQKYVFNPKGKVSVKTVSDDGTLLEGASFAVYNLQGALVSTMVTGSNGVGVSAELPIGGYFVKETSAPTGYQASTEKYSVSIVNKNQVAAVNGGAPIVNQKIKTSSVVDNSSPKEEELVSPSIETVNEIAQPQEQLTTYQPTEEIEHTSNDEIGSLTKTGNNSRLVIVCLVILLVLAITTKVAVGSKNE